MEQSPVAKLAALVRQAGEQQRQIVLELSKELASHNVLLERAIERESRLLQKVQRIEDHIMQKEMYHYSQIQQGLLDQKRARERSKLREEALKREQQQQLYLSGREEKVKDPLKEFDK
jgi:hypothetical protein